jgi:hypothetical protein
MAEVDPLSELLNVKVISGGLSALLLVPDPAESTVDVVNADEAIMRLFALLGAIVRRDPHLKISADDNGTDAESPDWPEAYRKVVAFVVWLLSDEQLRERFLRKEGDTSRALDFLRFVGSPEEAGLADSVKLERLLIFVFVLGLMMSQLMALASGGLISVLPIRPDLTVFDLISMLTSQVTGGQRDAHFSAAAAMANCLSSAAKHYGQVGEERERARLQATAGSVLHVQEFALLAGRAPHLLKKYGLKTVEERFEQQLSLALQSFGFRTIPTTRGARRGDIICITNKVPPAALLVEAKTSVRPYKLPVADERALLEYAQRLKGSSWTLFPLQLICIVGPDPDRKLAERLRHLENKAGVPVRYCSAVAMAALLMRPPTGVTAEDFVASLLDADRIVSTDHLISMSSKSEEKLVALRNLIKITLGSS